MTNTTASPATTGKRGIPLDRKLFTKASEKARTVRPVVMHIGAHYAVLMSDQRTWAHVAFCVWDGRIYASCNCKAHTRGDHGVPVPCYHIAAAVQSRNATAAIAPPAPVAPPECPNAPHCAPGKCEIDCATASEMADAAALHFEAERHHWEVTLGYGNSDKEAWR